MSSFGYLLAGFKMLGNKGLKRWIAIPLLINIVLFTLVIWIMSTYVADWIAYSASGVQDTWFDFLEGVIFWLMWLVFGVTAALFLYYFFLRIGFMIAGPFNSFLAERVEAQLTGDILPETDYKTLLKEIWPTIKNETAKLGYELLRTLLVALLCLALSFLGPLSILTPVIWFLFNAWLYGFLYLDYPLDNNGFKLKQELEVLHRNRATTIGFGAGVALITMIPVINFFVMPAAVIGGTKLWVEKIKPTVALPQNTNASVPMKS